jgi:NitT/TauT family transport system substrate-binding protein
MMGGRILKKLGFLVIVASIVLFSLGCISSSEKKPEITALSIGYQPTTHHIAEMVASEKGWWSEDLKQYGVKEIKELAFPSGTQEIQAIQAGDLDVAYIGTAALLIPLSQGLDAKIVAAANINGSNLIIKPGKTYNGPQSLIGLRIGTFPLGTIQDTLLKKWLLNNGVNISRVKILPMGAGDAVTAISTGKVDGVFLPEPASKIIEMLGKGKSVITSGEMCPNHACCSVVISGKLLREHPELVTQIIRTHINATNYANTNPEEAAKTYSNHTGQDPNIIEASMKTWDGKWLSDPHLLINSTLEYAKFQYKMNYTQKEITEKDLFETRLYDEVK